MGTIIGDQEPQTETDLRVAVRMFHPGEKHLIRFRTVAGIPHLNQLGDLMEGEQLEILKYKPWSEDKPKKRKWEHPLSRTRLIQIGATFNWEDFTKLFLDTKLIEEIKPYEA